MSTAPPARRSLALHPRLVLGLWIAFLLVLGRAGVVLALELAHHGRFAPAWLRLSHAFPAILSTGAALGVGAGLAAVVFRRSGTLSLLALFATAAAFSLFLAGRLDPDRSRHIGLDTPLGQAAMGAATLAALVLALFALRGLQGRWRGWFETSWPGALPPLVLTALLGLYLEFAHGDLGGSMRVRRVETDLVGATWEVLTEHPQAVFGPGLISPAAAYSPEGAARLALVLSPPARVRRILPESGAEGESESEKALWLVGGAGLDHGVAAEAAGRHPGHQVRLQVLVDGALAAEERLPLSGEERWRPLGGGEGLRVRGGARLELVSSLLDPEGNIVEPTIPLAAGFGGLALEERATVPRTRASRERPNLVLVLLDTLRADRTSAYGYARATTPHLEALARRGALFEEASATSSWTWPSTASVLTGLYPEEHGVEDATSSFLPETIDTLAEVLQLGGVTTAAWSGSPLIVPEKDFDQGFEFFDASREGRLRRSDLLVPGALEWLETAGEWRFFLYLHLMEPHAPYVPLPEGRARFAAEVPVGFDPRKPIDYSWDLQREGFDEGGTRRTDQVVTPEEQRWIQDLYDGCVWSGDHYLGLVLAKLEELGLSENTLVAVTSDHGEELFDHGLLAHAHSLHRELVRVPLVLAGPGVEPGARLRTPVSGAALGPTLARLMGTRLARPPAANGGAREDLDLFRDGPAAPSLFSTRQGWWNGYARQPILGLRKGSSVLHWAPEAAPWGGAQPGSGELRLYDLAQDPAETRDLAGLEPERARALQAELVELRALLEPRRIGPAAAPDAGTIDLLRGLGYVGK